MQIKCDRIYICKIHFLNEKAIINERAIWCFFKLRGRVILEKYFEDELIKTVKSINKLVNDNCFVFSLLSDVHIHPEKEEGMKRFYRTIENIKAVHNQCNIDAIFYLGDLELVTSVMHGSYWTEDIMNRELNNLKKSLLSCNENTYFVAGNHDGISARPSNPKNWYDKMIDKEKVQSVTNQGYFYVDFPKKKVRSVCLMDSHLESPEKTAFYGYSTEQLQWLSSVALDIPEDYNVLIFAHITLHSQDRLDTQINSSDLIGIFNAFQNKEKYESDIVCADFTNRNNGNICAFFGGHDHVQWAGKTCDIPFLQIETPSNLIHLPQHESGWDLPEGFVPVERRMYDLSEDLWNTVIFDTEKKTVYVVRFGAGEDAEYKI